MNNRYYWILIAAKCAGAVMGLLVAEMIAFRLSQYEQGLFFSFYALIGFYFISDGFSQIILVRSSHQYQFSKSNYSNNIDFQSHATPGFFRQSIIASIWQSLLSLILIILLGVFVFSDISGNSFQAWLLAGSSYAIVSLLLPGIAILEGLGNIQEIAWIRLAQTVGMNAGMLASFHAGAGLYSLGIGFLIMAIILFLYLIKWRKLLLGLFKVKGDYNWFNEIWPAQWRFCINGLAVCCSNSLPILVLRNHCGDEIAGRFGMTRRLLEIALFFGSAVVVTKASSLGSSYAMNEKNQFWNLWRKSMIEGGGILAVIATIICMLPLVGPCFGLRFTSRIVEGLPYFLMILTMVNAFIHWGIEILIRSDGFEPFLGQNIFRVLVFLLMLIPVPIFTNYQSIIVLSLTVSIVLLPWDYCLVKKFMKKWELKTQDRLIRKNSFL
jgi:hypothetical protein